VAYQSRHGRNAAEGRIGCDDIAFSKTLQGDIAAETAMPNQVEGGKTESDTLVLGLNRAQFDLGAEPMPMTPHASMVFLGFSRAVKIEAAPTFFIDRSRHFGAEAGFRSFGGAFPKAIEYTPRHILFPTSAWFSHRFHPFMVTAQLGHSCSKWPRAFRLARHPRLRA
jgi:hypothetical protein